MSTALHNPFLAKLMSRIRQHRPALSAEMPFFNRVEKVRGGNYVEVWFLTGGCTWDHQGGCTMCNYGIGPKVSGKEMVEAVRQALAAISVEVHELLVSPSGGMWDPMEVSPEALRCIYQLVGTFPMNKFLIETRAETVTPEAIDELLHYFPEKALGIELGLESACPWVQRFCVNKGSNPEMFEVAAEHAHSRGVDVYANVCLGTAFLTPQEAIEDAVKTVQWAFDHGAGVAVVFPLHIKPYTLLAALHQRGVYQAPSLWSLVEVLKQFDQERLDKIEISWYRSYYDDESKIVYSPTTCPCCYNTVIELLDDFRATQRAAVVAELDELQCDCKKRWRERINRTATKPLQRRVLDSYRKLATEFGLGDWWSANSPRIEHGLLSSEPHVGSSLAA